MKALWKFVLVLCVGLAMPLFVTAPAAAEDDAVVEMARQRFREGVDFFDKKQYDKARAAFLQAYALKAHPAVLLNLAQSELRSNREADAAAHFAQYLREHSEATEEQRQAAVEGLEAAKERVAEVKLDVSEPGADVSVDGDEVGKTPLADPIYLTPGSHTITATKGDETARVTVDVQAGDSKSETLKFAASAAPAGPVEAPAEEEPAAEDEEPEEAEEEEGAEEDDSQSEDFETGDGFFDWYANRPLAWVGTGVFVLGAGMGVLSAVTAKNYYESADNVSAQIIRAAREDMQPTSGICVMYPPVTEERKAQYQSACHKYDRNIEQGDRYEGYAVLSFVISGLALAGTITYYALDDVVDADTARPGGPRTATKPNPPLLVPYAAPGQAGLSVLGQF
jgi:hypothetical protein